MIVRIFITSLLGIPLFVLSCMTESPDVEESPLTQSTSPIETALKRRLIDPELPLKEVQEFTERRVLPVPEVSSVEQWEQYVQQTRQKLLSEVVLRGEAKGWAKLPTTFESLGVIDMDDYRIRKLRFEAVPGLWIPALLYEPKTLVGKVPVVLNVNGHDSQGKAADYKQIRCINQAKRGMLALNLEWVGMGQLRTSGFVHYKMNQLDLCGTSGLAVHYLSQKRALDILLQHPHADPKRVAVAGLSGGGWQTIFISALDPRVTLSNPVAGYSSFKTRARFTSDLGDSEQTPSDLATVADYTLLTAMRAPHATLLTNNSDDQCCFKAEHAQPPLVQAAAPIYQLYHQPHWLRTYVNHEPGSHNFERDNRQQLYKMIGDHFYGGLQIVVGHFNHKALAEAQLSPQQMKQLLGDVAMPYLERSTGLFHTVGQLMSEQFSELDRPDLVILVSRHFDQQTPETLAERKLPTSQGEMSLSTLVTLTPLAMPDIEIEYSTEEIECADEVKTAEELHVPLPEDNADFHSLAVSLAERISSKPLPSSRAYSAGDGIHAGQLRRLVSFHDWEVHALLEKEEQHDDYRIRYWWLRIGGLWTVPATEFIPANSPTQCRVMLADEGRASLSSKVNSALAAGERVLTFDPFYLGESKISQRDFLYGLLVATIGERNLGLQASQIAAITGWAKEEQPTAQLSLTAIGPRTSLMALVSSVCKPDVIDNLDLHKPFASLKEVIEQDLAVNQMPELFCFGLLKQYDIPKLILLSGVRKLSVNGRVERLKSK